MYIYFFIYIVFIFIFIISITVFISGSVLYETYAESNRFSYFYKKNILSNRVEGNVVEEIIAQHRPPVRTQLRHHQNAFDFVW